MLDGDDITMIAHASPQRVLPVSAQIGFRLPAFATALGRVLLAVLDDRALGKFLTRLKPEKINKLTVTDKTHLRKIILDVRKSGFALADQEVEVGFRSLAIPLKKRDGRVIAALNIGVHSERTPLKAMHGRFFQSLQRLAGELQQQLI